MPASHRLGFWQFFLPAAALFLSSCAVPLGAGYSIKKQSLDVHYLAGDPPRLEIRARYRLKNTGNRSLAALEVGLPEEKNYGRKNLRATLDGGEIATSALSKGAGLEDEARISFPRPWAQKEEHDLAIEYELTEPFAPYIGIAITGDSFFLSSAGWYPVLRPPEGLFGKGGDRQEPFELSVRVPRGFLARSSGRARGVRKENAELVYRFRIGPEDADPFIIAGRYFEQQFHNAEATILFWTLKAPLPQDQLARAGAHLAASIKEYESAFGVLSKKKEPYRVVGMLRWPSGFVAGFLLASTPSFPLGAVIPTQDDSEIKVNDLTLTLADYGLAQSWFASAAPAEPGSSSTFNEVLCHYAVNFVAGVAFGERTERNGQLQGALSLYPEMQKQIKERPLLSMTEGKVPREKLLALIKGELFLGALEDKCGQDNLRRALRHLVQSLRGSAYGYNELRSALEQECHQDLGPTFREWLTETGIPADFRQRYETKP